ncbi:TetR/AcrR family transcriptional regulator C-terminal domain-containing protein [Micromonospora sp. CA-240977]|uniref:TetR/AcrR family transcriptional regulator C-terminal domain-containing protein n=1 Tax=Micromonospora sp. CA-240977 TaxID=3239957 RepID=UPI003D92D2E9
MSKDTPQRLDPAAIVTSALRIADAEGLPAITIRRLAQEHGVTPMALYRHFRDKDDLLDALAARLLADIRLPEPSTAPWAEQIRAVLAACLAALRPHPTIAGLIPTRVLLSEPGLTLVERTLALLDTAGFPPDQATEIGSQALCSLVTLVATEPGLTESTDPDTRDDAIRAKRAALHALSPQRYPHVIAAADALTLCGDRDTYYELGIDFAVAGIRGIRPAARTTG